MLATVLRNSRFVKGWSTRRLGVDDYSSCVQFRLPAADGAATQITVGMDLLVQSQRRLRGKGGTPRLRQQFALGASLELGPLGSCYEKRTNWHPA